MPVGGWPLWRKTPRCLQSLSFIESQVLAGVPIFTRGSMVMLGIVFLERQSRDCRHAYAFALSERPDSAISFRFTNSFHWETCNEPRILCAEHDDNSLVADCWRGRIWDDCPKSNAQNTETDSAYEWKSIGKWCMESWMKDAALRSSKTSSYMGFGYKVTTVSYEEALWS